jgi:opacity protein-like surface antigen
MLRLVAALSLIVAAGASHAQLYWRLDAGYSETVNAGITNNLADNQFIRSGSELDDIGPSVVLSAGVGWRLSRNLRADVEFGYRGWYELKDSAPQQKFSADVISVSALLGVYWDFAVTWGQARPYLGAGVGLASNKIDPITRTTNISGFGVQSLTAPGGKWSGAAWSLMAGMQVPLTRRLTLDFGYRYIDLGKIESDSGVLECAPAALCVGPPSTYSGMSGRLRAHELMAGLRF